MMPRRWEATLTGLLAAFFLSSAAVAQVLIVVERPADAAPCFQLR